MIPESGIPIREKRGGSTDANVSRPGPARPIPTRVGVRNPGGMALPPDLAPGRVEFHWKLVWDENVRALVQAANSGQSAAAERPRETGPVSGPHSKLTTLEWGSEPNEALHYESRGINASLLESSTGGRTWFKWVVLAILLIAGSLGGYMYFTSGGAAKQQKVRQGSGSGAILPGGATIQMAPGGWRSTSAGDAAGMSTGRRFSLFPSLTPMTDYVVEFRGQVITNSLGWVVRAVDSRNYYAMRLELVKAGVGQEVALVRFAVVDGEQGAMKRIPVPLVIRDKAMKVRLDVVGPRITTYVDGRAVDYWNDTRLPKGTFGFMNDKEGRAEIKSVRVSSPGKTAGN
ncbi:MAG: hypothetical protein LLG20_20100 [Acidobacteriales bacterium]|nr:hypothetical protein [Terriglobales bacterium]